MSKASVEIVCDAGPLIHLDELDCLHLFNDFDTVFVPEQVWQEVSHHRPGALTNPNVTLQKVKVNVSIHPTFQSLMRSMALDYGEQAALTLMQSHSDAIFLTDDAAARLAAVTLGYQVHGSLGILIRAIRRNQMAKDEVLAILEAMPESSTLYVRPSLLKNIVDQVEKYTSESK